MATKRTSALRRLSIAIAFRECDICCGTEERVFEDSWTGKMICIECLSPVLDQVTNSPASEGDNLLQLLGEDGEEE